MADGIEIEHDDRHERLREKVRTFAAAEIAPRVSRMEECRAVDHEASHLIADQGWIGVTIPWHYGGMGLGHFAKTVIIEELSRVSAAMGAMAQASQLGVAKIINFGTEAQKKAWLPEIAIGRCLPTIATTEPDSGGHVLGMTCRAVRDGDDYVLNGEKAYVGNSHIGTLHGVIARTGEGSKGLTAFLVEAARPGLSIGEHRPAMGLHGFGFGELIFDDCRVPAANRLGAEGDGLAVAYSSSIVYGRPNLAAVALGVHRALVEETVAFAKERRRYGEPLCALPTVRQRLGRMQSRLMTARLALYHAVGLLDDGRACDAELINAKLVNAELVLDSAREAMEVHAAVGLFPESPVERYLRDAYHLGPPAGTPDIQRHRLAEVALGKGRSQWSQRFATPVDAADGEVGPVTFSDHAD